MGSFSSYPLLRDFFIFLVDEFLAKKTTVGRWVVSMNGLGLSSSPTLALVLEHCRGWEFCYALLQVVVLWFFWLFRNMSMWLTRFIIVIFSSSGVGGAIQWWLGILMVVLWILFFIFYFYFWVSNMSWEVEEIDFA